jgi:tellurite resistance protein TerC
VSAAPEARAADLFDWAKFPAEWSLGITFAILGAGVLYSLWRTRERAIRAVRDA